MKRRAGAGGRPGRVGATLRLAEREFRTAVEREHDPLGPGEIYSWTMVTAPTIGQR